LRKRIVIVGAILLVIGVAAAGSGIYLAISPFTASGVGLGRPLNTSTVISPGENKSIGTTSAGMVSIVVYKDNLSKPIQLDTSGTTTVSRSVSSNGSILFVSVFTSAASGGVTLHNNQTSTLEVEYSLTESTLGALASGGLLILGGGLLFIIGLVVLIVGLVMKKKQVQPQTV
jgi:hypothetical protein